MAQPTPCYHCGLPVPTGSHYQTLVLGQIREMCCPGCQAVAETIVKSGLESYYQHRSDAAINRKPYPRRSATNWRCTIVRTCSSRSSSMTVSWPAPPY